VALAGPHWECIRMQHVQGQADWPASGGTPQPAGPGAPPQPDGPGAPPQPAAPGAPPQSAAPGAPPQSAAPRPAAPSVPQPAGLGAPVLAEQRTFRLPGAPVAWWAWVIFAVACLIDVAVTGRNHTAAEIAATLVFVTGVVYACALRPRIIADSSGITVMNPVRDHRIPWGSVAGVDLKESVRVHCVKDPEAKRGKVIHSWALYAQRRSMLRAELRAQGDRRRLPRSAVENNESQISKQPAAQIMAKQLDELAKEARERGAVAGPRLVSWAWPAAAAILLPGILLLVVILAFR
jgi:hypothetical protein